MQHFATLAARAARALRRPLPLGIGLVLALAGAAQAQSTTYTFGSNNYTVPAGVTTIRVVALGGSGGTYESSSTYQRAKVQATLTVTAGEVLTVNVGRMGGYGSRTLGGGSGGSNGGGAGFNAGGGGGATDLRRSSARGSTGDYLTSRNALLVAGGGGGDAAANGNNTAAPGGVPNGSNGLGNGTPGRGATQTAAGGGGVPGSGATGGVGQGGANTATAPAGGGGGGYYGGGAGAVATTSQTAGGGGGSSWVTPTGSSSVSYSLDQTATAGYGTDGYLTITPIGSASYGYTGAPQTYIVPTGVTAVRVVATGASGGAYGNFTNYSAGGRVQAYLAVTPGEELTLLVGGQGGQGGTGTAAGGYNGGGAGTSSGAGGGASEVRRASTVGRTDDYLASRNALVVAGGGGGSDSPPATGGSGGAPGGGNGAPNASAYARAVGGGASQTAPGSGGSFGGNVGSPGSNGAGGAGYSSTYGSGGGGGYYGGGGGVPLGSGGGGSSWASAEALLVSYGVAPAIGNGSIAITTLNTSEYTYSGSPQTYTVPAGVTAVLVTATGGSGGGASSATSYAAQVQAAVLVTPGEVLTVMVGGEGANSASGSTAAGGYNGGGNAGSRGAGGGASDVRRASAVGRTSDYLASRNALLVAGGSGGSQSSYSDIGGAGGTPSGGNGQGSFYASDTGFGATQSGPGGGSPGGTNGTGGATGNNSGSGGGGGYYGGGGSRDGGGGGGSSWVMPSGSTGISYRVAPDAGPGEVSIVPVPLTDLVVSTADQPVTAGLYNSITVQSGGTATLTTNTSVLTSTTVQSGGVLNDGCAVLSGPGSFTLAAGGTMGICAAAGLSSSGSTGAVQVAGSRSFSPDASYVYNGTAAQVTGPGLPATVRALVLSNPAGLTLTGPVTATTAATLTGGVLRTGANALTLGSTATLGEDADGYALGTVQATRTLGTAGAAEGFGGLGLTLTPSGSVLPGSTLVRRTTGTARTGVGTSQSVKRVFDIQPTVTTGLNVALALTVRDDERNSIAGSRLRLFKSEDAGANWQLQPAATFSLMAASGSQPATYTARLAGISSFSLWTLGDAANPLPVELSVFTATPAGPAAVRLAWATASEQNSAAFDVERSLDGAAFAPIGTVAAAGNSSTARTYALLDAQLPAGAATLYYRLRQVDQDGTFSYSPVRTVALSGAAAGLALYPNPTTARTATLVGAQPGTAVTVTDALGRPVASATADAAGTAALALPAGLPAGVYLVRAGARAVRLTVE